MGGTINAFFSALPHFGLQAAVALSILALGLIGYAHFTPHRELEQIRQGNSAAAVAFGGVAIALAIPIASALRDSIRLDEVVIWGIVATLVQLIVFGIVDMVLRHLPQRIAEGDVGAAVFLVMIKIATALVLAAAVAG